ncbi:hypothetical protein GALMADRAFT_912099 [Galerina marginata CBS 339.88]|uniref:Uncharacterized protein n=1 Tax=Galerina marginata (strain CBS 339.88) TaxID=685588 RepID=A0A067SIK5_GALM3|nr:hypothetical protein GALMADRAFT_912099 [Galerina marginata CBS 339.88]
MSKFVHLEDPNYVAIANAIKYFYEDIIKPQRPDCHVLFDCPNALLDIIFVHTLGCDHIESWTHGKIYWPKELLPVDVAHARVIACHYPTNFAAFMKPDQAVMEDLAISLLVSLARTRSDLGVALQVSSLGHINHKYH